VTDIAQILIRIPLTTTFAHIHEEKISPQSQFAGGRDTYGPSGGDKGA
jgi:hypothetical protein